MRERGAAVTKTITSLMTRENLFLALILIGSFLLRAYRMGEAFGGFHGFNEAFYAIYAQKYLSRPITDLLVGAQDFNNPPLFTLLVYLSFKFFGVSEFSARLVPVLFGVLSVFFTYRVGSLLYNERIGLISALVMAFNPAYIIVGRNVQIDAVFVCFILIAAYYYLKSTGASDVRNKCLAGLFLGLGAYAKQPALLFLGVIVLWEIGKNWDFSWLKWSFAYLIIIPFLVSLPWFVYHSIINPEVVTGVQSARIASLRFPNLAFLRLYFLNEVVWMFSPVVFVIVIAGIVFLFWERSDEDKLILWSLGVYTLFYFFFHQHSYYLLPIVPFACMAGAKFIYSMKSELVFVFILSAILATSIFYSVLLLAGHEYGYHEFKDLGEIIEREAGTQDVVIQVTETLSGSYGPLVEYYVPEAKVTVVDTPKKESQKTYFLDFWWFLNVDSKKGGVYATYRTIYFPTAFGYVFYQTPPSNHFFTQGKIKTLRVSSVTDFGFTRLEVPSLLLIDLDEYKGDIEVTSR